MKAVWLFNNEEHKEEITGKLFDLLVEYSINKYSTGVFDAMIRFGKEGKLNLE